MQRRVSELKRTASMESRRTNSSSSSSGAPSPCPRPDGEHDAAAAVFAPKRSLARSPGVRRRRCCLPLPCGCHSPRLRAESESNWSVWVPGAQFKIARQPLLVVVDQRRRPRNHWSARDTYCTHRHPNSTSSGRGGRVHQSRRSCRPPLRPLPITGNVQGYTCFTYAGLPSQPAASIVSTDMAAVATDAVALTVALCSVCCFVTAAVPLAPHPPLRYSSR